MGTTKKPTGMSVTRNGAKITCTWKKPEKYNDGQQCYVRLKYGGSWGHFDNGTFKSGWLKLSCTNTTTAKTYTNTLSRYYPNSGKKKLTDVEFRVRGKHNGDKWSAYTTDSFAINPPHKPKVTKTVTEGVSNQAVFSWTLSTSNTSSSHAYFTELQWEAILIKGCQETKGSEAFSYTPVSGSKLTGTSSTSSSRTISESNIADGSYSRWFRARAVGPGGASDWVYAHQVYAKPSHTNNVETEVINSVGGGYECYTSYTAPSDIAYPIDTTTVQYAFATPDAGLNYPLSGTSLWVDGNTTAHKKQNDEMRFHVNADVTEDKCLFVRVNNTYNSETTEGYPKIIKYGKLKTPTISGTISTSDVTHKATVTATNNSEVPDSFIAIVYQGSTQPQKVVGIIPAGSSDSVTVQCPNWDTQTAIKFGLYAVVGTASYTTDSNNVRTYTFKPYNNRELMTSDTTWQGGTVPQAPTNVSVAQTSVPGTIRVNWDWPWEDADGTEISWSDHDDAWESTDQPETYKISNLHVGQWNIAGLTTGMRWYVRVRLIKGTENEVFGPYSEIQEVNLASAPNVPTLVLSAPIVSREQSFTASWGYTTTDGTGQGYAEICEATVTGSGITYGTPFIHTTTAQHVTIDASRWAVNTTHYLCVRVVSESGQVCDEWSAPVPIKVANPLSCSITTGSNLSNVTVEDDSVDGTTKTVLGLTDMPLTVTVTGAGDFGTTTLAIERAESYFLEQPNETYLPAHAGETVALVEQIGEAAISIDNEDLIGSLDDGAAYKFVATVSDTLGQRATAELPFEVHWTNQAKAPTATIQIDETDLIAKITPAATSPGTGDTCDIYRLSVDRPSLVYSGAAFGTMYVDPFPTIGEYGGYRLVYRTKNGDYTIADNEELAFTDYRAADSDTYRLDTMYNIIEFGGDRVQLMYDVTISNSWEKDFQATQYLGGAIQGDWNPAVARTGSVASRVVTIKDQETIQAMRRLADYAGICHVRTRDGSSYPANVDVSENYNMGQEVIAREFTISITRVDPEGFDGQTYADWVNS